MRRLMGDEARVGHMPEAIGRIEQFLIGRTRDSLGDDLMFRAAIERQLEIIGEASSHLISILKDEYDDIPWSNIKTFRNVIAHEYFGVNQNTIWTILTDEIAPLKITLLQIQHDKNFRT